MTDHDNEEGGDKMAILMVHDSPGATREQYAQVISRLTGGRGLNSLGDWPVDGILAHTAGPSDDGWCVIDVWESEQAFRRFGEVIGPVLEELGYPGEPRIHQVQNFVK